MPGSQDEERRLKPGTIKRSALEVLHAAGAGGMPIGTIMDAIKAQNLRQWDAKSKRVVQFVRSQLSSGCNWALVCWRKPPKPSLLLGLAHAL